MKLNEFSMRPLKTSFDKFYSYCMDANNASDLSNYYFSFHQNQIGIPANKIKHTWLEHQTTIEQWEILLQEKAHCILVSKSKERRDFDNDTYLMMFKSENDYYGAAFANCKKRWYVGTWFKGTYNGILGWLKTKGETHPEVPTATNVPGFPLSEGFSTNIITETKENVNPFNQNFWKWFGNSKVVNDDGTPKIVSHRSNQTFDRFDKAKISSFNLNGKGFYFSASDTKGKKDSYGKNIGYYYLKMENPLRKSEWVDRETLEKYFDPDVVVYIFNRVKTSTARQGNKVQWVMVFFNLWNYRMDFGKDLHVEEVLKDMGYDGIIDDMIEDTYVVFEPNQIKSVDNKGMWSDSDNIYEQLNKLFEELL